MRLDLAERLRCPRPHAATPLIVVAEQVEDRELVAGVAGCPVCHLEARIDAEGVWFPEALGRLPDRSAAEQDMMRAPVGDEDLQRTAALLGLAEPGGTVLLTGRYARFAERLAHEFDVAIVIVGAPPHGVAAGAGVYAGVYAVHLGGDAVPFTDHTFRAAALDAVASEDAIRTVAVGGRILGAWPLARPATVKELARDEREWVGEREAPVRTVSIGRAKGG